MNGLMTYLCSLDIVPRPSLGQRIADRIRRAIRGYAPDVVW